MRVLPLVLVAILLAGCTAGTPQSGTPAKTQERKVTLLTYSAFGVKKEVFDNFTNLTGIAVEVLAQDDAGAVVNKAIVTKDNPVADVLFGVDNALIHRAKANGLFQPYESPNAQLVAERYKAPFRDANSTLLATPFDYGYVMLNYDTAWFAQHNVSLPTDLRQVANETYAPLTVVENPQTSSPGFAFLLATVAHFGDNGTYTYKSFWSDYAKHGGKVAPTWDQAYGSDFSQGWDDKGARDRPIVLSYSTSPAYNPMNGYGDATSANLDLPEASWWQVEAFGILAHAKHVEEAKKLIDYMLTVEVQEQGAFQQVEYPVLAGAQEPDAYVANAPKPVDPAYLASEQVEQGRDAWLAGWRDATGQA